MRTYYSTRDKIYHQLRTVNGVRIWDVDKFFSQSHVRKNFGISYIEVVEPSYKSEVIFHILDEQKFLLKVLKYGF